MKKIALILVLMPTLARAYDIRVNDAQIVTSKYTLYGVPIFTDQEKAALLAKAVDTGTGPVKDADFLPDSVPQADLDIISALNLSKGAPTRTQALADIAARKADPSFGQTFVSSAAQAGSSGYQDFRVYAGSGTLLALSEEKICPKGVTVVQYPVVAELRSVDLSAVAIYVKAIGGGCFVVRNADGSNSRSYNWWAFAK